MIGGEHLNLMRLIFGLSGGDYGTRRRLCRNKSTRGGGCHSQLSGIDSECLFIVVEKGQISADREMLMERWETESEEFEKNTI